MYIQIKYVTEILRRNGENGPPHAKEDGLEVILPNFVFAKISGHAMEEISFGFFKDYSGIRKFSALTSNWRSSLDLFPACAFAS